MISTNVQCSHTQSLLHRAGSHVGVGVEHFHQFIVILVAGCMQQHRFLHGTTRRQFLLVLLAVLLCLLNLRLIVDAPQGTFSRLLLLLPLLLDLLLSLLPVLLQILLPLLMCRLLYIHVDIIVLNVSLLVDARGGGISVIVHVGEISDFLYAACRYIGCLRTKTKERLHENGKALLSETLLGDSNATDGFIQRTVNYVLVPMQPRMHVIPIQQDVATCPRHDEPQYKHELDQIVEWHPRADEQVNQKFHWLPRGHHNPIHQPRYDLLQITRLYRLV